MSYDPLDSQILEIENHLRDLTPEERDRILDWIKNGKQKATNIKKLMEEVSNSFDTLRVVIKYMVFDLECTRRENKQLQETIAQLQEALEGHGLYAEDTNDNVGVLGEWSGDELPEGEGGLIDVPNVGDFIHNTECDHPYDCDCECEFCHAFRNRMSLGGDGAD